MIMKKDLGGDVMFMLKNSKFLKEETRKRSMTPKEYGIMLQKKKKEGVEE